MGNMLIGIWLMLLASNMSEDWMKVCVVIASSISIVVGFLIVEGLI